MEPELSPLSLCVIRFKALLLSMSDTRSVASLLALIVDQLREQPHAALARIWLVDKGDLCAECRFRSDCPDQRSCLHLVASAGKPMNPSEENWDGIDGSFRRFPIGVRKVGHIAATAEPVEVAEIGTGSHWIAEPAWAQREQIRGFVGQPLVYKGEVLGVLGIFLRVPVLEDGSFWLRMIADHAASAIANARAFEEIHRLQSQLALENAYLRDEVRSTRHSDEIIGGQAIARVLEQVELVAPTDSGVLVLGESGVGKELVARAIHERSPRRESAMIRVNCASIPRELFESEFFGHVEGSFTGAVRDRAGRFELADGGTLFLDEVGEIPLEMQGKLLRVLQEGTYERIGEEATRSADVRIVAATNRNLEQEVDAKRFRKDLYYRLSVFPIEVPPLRHRREDIPALAAHFLDQQGRRLGKTLPGLKRRHAQELQAYEWPGNVRELQNVIERAAIRSLGGRLEFDVPAADARAPVPTTRRSRPGRDTEPLLTYDELRRQERANVLAVLEAFDWKISGANGAAEFLGIHPATLSSRLRAMNLRRPPIR